MNNSPTPKNLVMDLSYSFALKIVELYKYLTSQQKEYVLSKQLLRSGTSIGANISEAQAAISKKDFTAKMSIASKEARESKYWLRLLSDSHYINKNKESTKKLLNDSESLIKLTTKIVKSSQEKK